MSNSVGSSLHTKQVRNGLSSSLRAKPLANDAVNPALSRFCSAMPTSEEESDSVTLPAVLAIGADDGLVRPQKDPKWPHLDLVRLLLQYFLIC
jgi:hypothetical protein